VEVQPGRLSYRCLDDTAQWWFDGEHNRAPDFLDGMSDLDVLNLWRQGVAAVAAAIGAMNRRGFPLPVKVGESDASVS